MPVDTFESCVESYQESRNREKREDAVFSVLDILVTIFLDDDDKHMN